MKMLKICAYAFLVGMMNGVIAEQDAPKRKINSGSSAEVLDYFGFYKAVDLAQPYVDYAEQKGKEGWNWAVNNVNSLIPQEKKESAAPAAPAVQAESIPGVTESQGYLKYYGQIIFDRNSDEARIAHQLAKLTDEQRKKIEEKLGAAYSQASFAAEVLKLWYEEHPVTLSTYDKVIGGTLFATVVAAYVAYRYCCAEEDQQA